MEAFFCIFCVFTLFFVLSSVYSELVYLNPKFPLKEPTFSLTSSPLLWPQPSEWVSSPLRYRVPGSIFIRTSRKLRYCDILRHNVDKYGIVIRNLIYSSTTASFSSTEAEQTLKEIYLFVENGNCSKHLYPSFEATRADDESYSIEVQANSGKAILFASNVWGAVRALETITQMMYVDKADQKSSHSMSGVCEQLKAVFVNVSRIQDKPRFRYRGVMIDTARHFIPTKTIIKNLDAMGYNKFNTLHWHINDDQTFPFGSKQFANFSHFASYTPLHVYRYQDIKLINEEARLRGIQVILEIDSPGHGFALGKVFPDLLTSCGPSGLRVHKRLDSEFGNTLDATKESTYQTLSLLLTELINLFPSKLIHLGMDDVNYDCWNSSPSIREFMSSNKMHNTALLEEYYAKRLIDIVHHLGRSQIVWQDPMDNGAKLPKGTIVQVWKDTKLLSEFVHWREYMSSIVKKNYSVILSSCWFLSFIRYGQDWRDMYNCDPYDIKASEEQKEKFILGGEACLWGEYVDGSNFMSRLWPRASAVAERLWSENIAQNLNDVQYRLDAQRCRMLSRGIAAAPLQTGFCSNFDWNSASHTLDEELNLTDPVEAADEATNETNFDGGNSATATEANGASVAAAVKRNIAQQVGSTGQSGYEYHSSKRLTAIDNAVAATDATIGFFKDYCEDINSDGKRSNFDSEPLSSTSTERSPQVNMNSEQQQQQSELEREDGERAEPPPVNEKKNSLSKASTLNWISGDRQSAPDLHKSAGRKVQRQWMGNLVMLSFTMFCRLVDDLFA